MLYKNGYSSKFCNIQRKNTCVEVSFWWSCWPWESPTQVFCWKYCEIFKNIYFENHLQTAVSVHFKIKRRIQHPVNYLRCFWKKLLVRCLTVENTYLEKKALRFYHFFILSLSYLRQYKIIRPTQNTFTSRPIFRGELISMQALSVKWSFSGSSFDSFSTSMNYSIFAKRANK